MKEGDLLLGLSSTGIHSNGFSLVRKIIAMQGLTTSSPCPWSSDKHYPTLGHALLEPTAIYAQLIPLCRQGLVKGLSHITGGGFVENIPRMLPKHLGCEVDVSSWQLPEVFKWLMKKGGVEPKEMARTFNCGVGMVAVVAAENVDVVEGEIRRSRKGDVYRIGRLCGSKIQLKNLEIWSQ